jgi:hypothetical protein
MKRFLPLFTEKTELALICVCNNDLISALKFLKNIIDRDSQINKSLLFFKVTRAGICYGLSEQSM